MILCPRCSTLVDERIRTTCPRCSAPISAVQQQSPGAPGRAYPPQPPYAPPGYAPPPGSPYTPPAPSGYAPPPGSPYAPPNGTATAPPPLQGGVSNNPAQQSVPQPMAGAPTRTRVSLTGEVIQDVPPPGSAPYPGQSPYAAQTPYPGAPMGVPNAYPGPVQPQPGVYMPPSAQRPVSNGSPWGWRLGGGGGALFVLYLALRIALILYRTHVFDGAPDSNNQGNISNPFHFGGESNPFAAQMTDPSGTARETLNAIHAHDWRKFYYLCSFENNENKTAAEAGNFVSEFNRLTSTNSNAQTFDRAMGSMTNILVGGVQMQGNAATASTSSTIQIDGESVSLHGSAHMIQVDGRWMVDLRDAGQSTSYLFKELLGLNSMQATGPTRSLFSGGDGGFFSPPVHHFAPGSIPRHSAPSYSPPAFTPPTYTPPAYQPPGVNLPTPNIPNPTFSPGGSPYTPAAPRYGPGNIPHGPQDFPSPPSGYGPGSFPHGPSNIPGPPSGFGPHGGGFGGGMPGSGGGFNTPGSMPGPPGGGF